MKLLAALALILAASPYLTAQVRPAIVRDADHPARQPVTLIGHFNESFTNSTKEFDICTAPSVCTSTVPAGKRLVIETLSARCKTFSSVHLQFFHFLTILHGIESSFYLSMPRILLGPDVYYSGGQAVRIYADPLSKVKFTIEKEGGGLFFGRTAGSGYLVDLN
jgi:hypothetical protein